METRYEIGGLSNRLFPITFKLELVEDRGERCEGWQT
jgi:hypothetical protein